MSGKWDKYQNVKDEWGHSTTSTAKPVPKCYESHPALLLGKGTLQGGACRSPITYEADVYVALQAGDSASVQSDPWEEQTHVEVQFSIPDMGVPVNVTRFKKMVTWLCTQLQDGKHVHVGCIGGHGRTGLVITAIVAELNGTKDAIQWVRKHYCDRAVESQTQVKWLMTHYGVSDVEGSKAAPTTTTSTGWSVDGHAPGYKKTSKQGFLAGIDAMPAVRKLSSGGAVVVEPVRALPLIPEGATGAERVFEPMRSTNRSLWRARGK